MTSRKSRTCSSQRTGQPLTEYTTEYAAQAGAGHVRLSYGKALVPYQCSRCDLWHLTPRDRQTPSQTCGYCRGSDGSLKEAYASEEDAERRAAILARARAISLRAYPCPHGQGWHLTKR